MKLGEEELDTKLRKRNVETINMQIIYENVVDCVKILMRFKKIM